jgi:wobble nucleotide-excising tRNase
VVKLTTTENSAAQKYRLFDSVSTGANISLAPITLIYAENGRGKTTLAAILRSLATGDPVPIEERLATQSATHMMLKSTAPEVSFSIR